MVALVLQNGFFPELDAVLFLQLFNQRFEEFKLLLLLFDFGLDFEGDAFLDSPLVHLLAANLTEQLPVSHGPHQQAFFVEFITEFYTASFISTFLAHLGPLTPYFQHLLSSAVYVNPTHY